MGVLPKKRGVPRSGICDDRRLQSFGALNRCMNTPTALALSIGFVVVSTYTGVRIWNRFFPSKKDEALTDADADACPSLDQIPLQSDKTYQEAAWPPQSKPAPVLSVKDMFNANAELIRKICQASGLDDEQCQKYLLPVITNLARQVHLLPASEQDHHSGYGGLFTHSLEVALAAANRANNSIFDLGCLPIEKEWNEKRWYMVCILAGLLHDVGKPETDMKITLADGKSWPPSMPLLNWLRAHHADCYYVAFKPDRKHNEHVMVALQKIESIIPQATRNFLSATGIGDRLNAALRDALSLGKDGGQVGAILASADGGSRDADKARQRQINPVYKNVSHPQGDQLLKAIRVLISQGAWTVNYDVDSQVFNTKQGCFIVWNADNTQAIRDQALKMGFEGLPSDFLKIAEILMDSQVAIPNKNEVTNTSSLLWQVTPIVMGKGSIPCLRMKDPGFIFDTVVPSQIEAVIEGTQPDDVTKKAWQEKWNFVPLPMLSPEEAMVQGINEDFLTAERLADEERAAAEEEQLEAQRQAEDAFAALGDMEIPPSEEKSEPVDIAFAFNSAVFLFYDI